jgi:hypothetical protein
MTPTQTSPGASSANLYTLKEVNQMEWEMCSQLKQHHSYTSLTITTSPQSEIVVTSLVETTYLPALSLAGECVCAHTAGAGLRRPAGVGDSACREPVCRLLAPTLGDRKSYSLPSSSAIRPGVLGLHTITSARATHPS